MTTIHFASATTHAKYNKAIIINCWHCYVCFAVCVLTTVAMIGSGARCDSGVPISGQVGFLTSVKQATPVSRSLHCRWNISVSAGRTINVTLFDFGVYNRLRTSADNRYRSR